MKSTKNYMVRFRVDKDTKAILDSKVAASGIKISEFMRQIIRNGEVHPMTDGKEIVRQVAMLHEDMLNYHNDLEEQVQTLKKAVEDNSMLLKQSVGLFNSPVIRETIATQRARIFAVMDTIMDRYNEKERNSEEALHHCLTTGNLGKGR